MVESTNCLWEGPDVRFNKDFNDHSLNSCEAVKKIMSKEVKEGARAMSQQIENNKKKIL